MPPSVDEWLPERHLARFVVEVIDALNLKAMSKTYRGSGSASYHPAVLLGLLIYGCASGVFSGRKLERATYDLVAFRFIAGNDHPDHDTIAAFRRRFLKQIEALDDVPLVREMPDEMYETVVASLQEGKPTDRSFAPLFNTGFVFCPQPDLMELAVAALQRAQYHIDITIKGLNIGGAIAALASVGGTP